LFFFRVFFFFLFSVNVIVSVVFAITLAWWGLAMSAHNFNHKVLVEAF
jgi:hypothetical protein